MRQVGVWVGKVLSRWTGFSGSELWLLHTDTQLCSVLSLPFKEELLLPPVPPHPQPEETLPTRLPAFSQGPPCPPEIPPKPPRLLPEFGECHRTAGLWVAFRAQSWRACSGHVLCLHPVFCLPRLSMAGPWGSEVPGPSAAGGEAATPGLSSFLLPCRPCLDNPHS